ncbi:MAG: hypothetical protein M3512_00875 [Bacteroidota bacterium]|nr:hypothetical protein [Bacteroidota bacterium]
MTDIEFEILDELYFVVSFKVLVDNISIEEEKLVPHLRNLINKGWVRCFLNIAGDEPTDISGFDKQYMKYYYLASKEGLKAHNSL